MPIQASFTLSPALPDEIHGAEAFALVIIDGMAEAAESKAAFFKNERRDFCVGFI
jgi:hypothetical protein